MPVLQDFSLSLELKKREHWAALGIVVGRRISNGKLLETLAGCRKFFEAKMAVDRPRILRSIGVFDSYFKSWGFDCPLLRQFKAAEKGRTPASLPLVQALLACETATGVLMGAHDLDRIQGDVVADIAGEEDCFQGMRFPVFCKPGEIVLHDAMGVVASFFQGPDNRSLVHARTENAVFFVFNAPGLEEDVFRGAVATVAELIQPAAEEIEWKVFS